MEAVKQGSATVSLKSDTHAVLVALKRASSDLSSHQKKILPIDDHVGISIAGLTADARSISKWMRAECMNSRYAHDTPLPISRFANSNEAKMNLLANFRLIGDFGNKMQICTQRYGKRPYGVGLLVAGYDDKGAHIYQTCPSANFYGENVASSLCSVHVLICFHHSECRAMAIGARSQAARTYLEKYLDSFKDCDYEELVKHGLRALRDTLPNEVDLTNKNVSISVVGKDHDFTIYDDARVDPFLAAIEGEERRGQRPAAEGEAPKPEDANAAGMDTD